MSYEAHLLVVDDEEDLRQMLEEYLTDQGFRVSSAGDAGQARAVLEAEDVQAALLDVAMPGEDGFSLARHIRETSDIGILMVTSADDVFDRVVGLEIGADDYITKPFDLRELLMRVRSVLRRSGYGDGAGDRLAIGRFELDLKDKCLRGPSGEATLLTKGEFDLLHTLATHPNEVLTREQLLDMAGGGDVFDRSIDVRIARLRQKIEEMPAKPCIIKTIRGAGYKFLPQGS